MEFSETHITEPGPLHNADGTLATPGWSRALVLDYDRSRIAAKPYRIKEWDYYLINDDFFAVALTVGDLGYMGLMSASIIDLEKGGSTTESVLSPFPMGRFNMPSSSAEGITEFRNDRVHFRFEVADGRRIIHLSYKRFKDSDTLTVDATLDCEPQDTMVIATPWREDPKAFYYNQKIVAMRASGSFKLGRTVHGFSPETSFGLLDWGRGVWTRDNIWYWGCAQGWQDGTGGSEPDTHVVGFNLGYGFGDTTAASENMFFLDGVCHKLGRVDFDIPRKKGYHTEKRTENRLELMQPWHVTDNEGRLDLVFTPLHDRIDYMNFGLVLSDQHQVFGSFDGTVVLDDGTPFTIAGLKGSAEVIHNKY